MKIDDVMEYMDLIHDDNTVVSYNYCINGSAMIDAYVRPHSRLKDRYINPHRNLSGIDLDSIKACPRCDTSWHDYDYTPVVNKKASYIGSAIPCKNRCGVSISTELHRQLLTLTRGSINIEEPTGETMPRADKNENPLAGLTASGGNPFAGLTAMVNDSPMDTKNKEE